MFDPTYVAGLASTPLTDDELERVRSIALRLGYVVEDDDYDDGGLTATTAAAANLTAAQLRLLRAWLAYYGGNIVPGRVKIEGGDDGVIYNDELEQYQPEEEICMLVFKVKAPADESAWPAFS